MRLFGKKSDQKSGKTPEKSARATRDELDYLKSRVDVPDMLFDQFQVDRASDTYQSVHDVAEPLVTVCIATYNRGQLLLERSVRSVLAQTWRNIEVIVVGDCCTDDTAERMAAVRDPRVTFVNLPQRGNYPVNPEWRWMVAGSVPMNEALARASGHYITHLDDDDEYTPDRVETLLATIRRERADLVWHPFLFEDERGKWQASEAAGFQLTQVTTSSVFYHHWFRRIGWDINAYKLREPGDWNRFRKFKYLGAKTVRDPRLLLRHYRERAQAGR